MRKTANERQRNKTVEIKSKIQKHENERKERRTVVRSGGATGYLCDCARDGGAVCLLIAVGRERGRTDTTSLPVYEESCAYNVCSRKARSGVAGISASIRVTNVRGARGPGRQHCARSPLTILFFARGRPYIFLILVKVTLKFR